jgi:hypothetical protein
MHGVDDVVGVLADVLAKRRAGQHANRRRARRPRAEHIGQGVAHDGNPRRGDSEGGRKGHDHAGVGLGAEAGITARDEGEIVEYFEHPGLQADRGLRVVGDDAEPVTLPAEPARQRGEIPDGRQARERGDAQQARDFLPQSREIAAAERARPKRRVNVEIAREERRIGRKLPVAWSETTDLGETAKGALVTGCECLHDLVSGGTPCLVEIYERSILVKENGVERHEIKT